MTVEGMDEVTTFHRNAQGIVYSNHWTRNWLESGWRLNGNTFSNGGIGGPGLSPGAPAGNTDGITTPVEMTSEGTLKVVVQYSGDPQQMPTEVGVVVDSTAFAAFLPSGNSQADNGLGDESEYSSFMVEEGAGGLGGERSSGRNLRIIPLNSSGYGELEFSPSASATSSANTPLVWAEAQSATATLDPRTIWVRRLGDPHTFYEPDHDATTMGVFNYTPVISGATFATISYSHEIIPKKAVVPDYNAFATSTMRVTKGLSPKHGVPQSTQLTYHGHSTFLYSQPGHGTFFWEVDNLVPPNQLSGTCTNQNDHDQYVNADVGHPYYLSSLMFHAGQFHDVTNGYEKYDEDETHSAKYNVNWGDGVKGSAELVTTWMPKAFYIDQSSVTICSYENVVSGSMSREFIPITGSGTNGEWVFAGYSNITGIKHAFPEIIKLASGASGTVQAGQYFSQPLQLTGILKERVVSGILEGANFLLNPLVASGTFPVARNNHPIGVFQDGVQVAPGTPMSFFTDPDNYRWKPFCVPNRYVKLGNVMLHGEDGYSGNAITESIWKDDYQTAPKGIFVERVIPGDL